MTGSSRGGSARAAGGAACWFLLLAAWLVFSPGPGRARVALAPSWVAWEMLGNLVLLAPAAIALALGGRGSPVRRVVRTTLLLGGASVAIELVQWFAEGLARTAHPVDVALNTAGAAAAAAATVALRAAGVSGRRILVGTAAVVAAALAAYALDASVERAERHRLVLWDPGFEVAAGDEVGGGRAFRGDVSAARVCAGEPAREVCAEPGGTEERRRRLVEAALGSQRAVLSAEVTSASDEQRGPARMVTFSRDTLDRNATLGQEGAAVMLRLRTPAAGLNGDEIQYRLPDAVPLDRPTRVRAVYDRGLVTIRTETGGRVVSGQFPTASSGAWWLGRRGWRPLEPAPLMRATAVGAVLVMGTLGMAIAGAGPPGPWMPVAGMLAGAAGLYGLTALAGIEPAPFEPLLAAAGGALGGGLAWLDGARLRTRAPEAESGAPGGDPPPAVPRRRARFPGRAGRSRPAKPREMG